jgi:hypothetical protein
VVSDTLNASWGNNSLNPVAVDNVSIGSSSSSSSCPSSRGRIS